MRAVQHGGAWLMVALMYGALAAMSFVDGQGGATLFAAFASPAEVERALTEQMTPPRRGGWEVHPTLAGFAPGRLGFERYDDVEPVWTRGGGER